MDRTLLVNPSTDDIVSNLVNICGNFNFDVLHLDLSTQSNSIDKIIKNEYNLIVFQYVGSSKILMSSVVDLINYGYLSGKKILLVTDQTRMIAKIEDRLGESIKNLKNIKYVIMPIDSENFRKRFDQLHESIQLKSTHDIFNDLQTQIVKCKNMKHSRLDRLIEHFI